MADATFLDLLPLATASPPTTCVLAIVNPTVFDDSPSGSSQRMTVAQLFQTPTIDTLTVTTNLTLGAGTHLNFSTRGQVYAVSDGAFLLSNNAGTGITGLIFGVGDTGHTGLFPTTTTLAVRLGDNSADAALTCLKMTASTRTISGVDVATSVASLVLGDAAAASIHGFSPASQILNLDSRRSSTNTTGAYLHAHVYTNQSVATTGSAQGVEAWTQGSHTSGTVASLFGLIGNLEISGVGGSTTLGNAITGGAYISGGTVASLRCGSFGGVTVDGASAVATTATAVQINNPTVINGGTLGTLNGLQIEAQTSGTTNWAIYCKSSAASGGVSFRDTALATNATVGFLHIPSCAGPPTGTPSPIPTGQIPLVYDSVNNFLYVYAGAAWKKSTVYA